MSNGDDSYSQLLFFTLPFSAELGPLLETNWWMLFRICKTASARKITRRNSISCCIWKIWRYGKKTRVLSDSREISHLFASVSAFSLTCIRSCFVLQHLCATQKFNDDRASFTRSGEYLVLEIPHLAESRPSLMAGDRLYACEIGAKDKKGR